MVLNKLKDYGNLVMFSHSIFSLPFGLTAMLFASNLTSTTIEWPPFSTFFWILVALLAARNGANAFNRVADKEIDKKNPRTRGRDIPMGRVNNKEAVALTVFCFTLLSFAAYQLNTACLLLLPIAIAICIFYSYSKRVTWLCHYILGIACGGAPVGAWIAIRGFPFNWDYLTAILLGAVVCFWIAGFDIIYATQDIDFDRKEKIFSIPSRFGFEKALLIAKGSHLIAIFLLALLPFFFDKLNVLVYGIGVVLIAALLLVEHYNINPKNQKKMKLVSYSINQVIGIVFFIFTIGALFL